MSFYHSKEKISQLAETESSNDEKKKTYVFWNEGHTLGNALKLVMANDPKINFCGYTVPHPSESKMHFRIQMNEGRAVDALRKGLEDVVKMCDHMLTTFDNEMESYTNNSSQR
ncbi:probable DNA-directed RNA polymerases I and III subunit RPAC2 [Coccinella septempunctata]|uniref:probable DNA-directed RNA polymerases I and III subunit RPAC2 n=1 Tax=Coccinella septempunctata TaxID=41139 RepID=UPI001D073E41|nr:probable DNA-directed RNA polymerases I and III subunit RPAC2 [Coccinella septempunctata]